MTAGTIKAVRLLGEHLELMARVPEAATPALAGFCGLVRYYVWAVVDLFTAPDSLEAHHHQQQPGGGVAGLLSVASPRLKQVPVLGAW